MARDTLIKNGVALIHDANNHVLPTKTDILIRDGKIAKLAPSIEAEGVDVVDATDKIVSPGFIDTHHHCWQTQLKGRHANETLLDYMITGYMQHVQYSPKDVFYGQLAGMLEALAAGTTTVIDHAHINASPEHAKLGIAGTASSGIRSIFCYTPMMIAKSFNPLTFHANPLEDWVMETFSELADQGPFGDGRVTLGFAWDLWYLGAEVVGKVFETVAAKKVRTVTTHGSGLFNVTQVLKAFGLLDKRVVISHGGNITKTEAALIREGGAHLSATPSTELQMALGQPLCFDAAFPSDAPESSRTGVQDCASLGIDCHSNNANSVISEARIGLQNARGTFNEQYLSKGKMPRKLPDNLSVEAAFNLATIQGAKAASFEEEIGRIQEGYRADLVLFDALSPRMLAAAQQDPVAAIILHSSPADIEMVMVDGVVRKREGKLVGVKVDQGVRETVGKEELGWSEIASELLQSREKMQPEAEKVDVKQGIDTVMGMWQIPQDMIANVD